MKSSDYVLKHNFGYGQEPEVPNEKLNKLKLRNYEDVKFYVGWSLREIFHAKITKFNIVKFYDSKIKTKVVIEDISPRDPWY